MKSILKKSKQTNNFYMSNATATESQGQGSSTVGKHITLESTPSSVRVHGGNPVTGRQEAPNFKVVLD